MSFSRAHLRPLGCLAFAAALAVCFPFAADSQGEQPISPRELGQIWDAEHVSPPLPPLLDHDEVVRRLKAVAGGSGPVHRSSSVGASVEGTLDQHDLDRHRPFRVLLWSQMHGDEPTATAALFDVFDYLQRHRGDPRSIAASPR